MEHKTTKTNELLGAIQKAHHVTQLAKQEKQEEAADYIYNLFHEKLGRNDPDYEFIDQFILMVHNESLGSSLCRSILSLSFKEKDKFPHRWLFYECVFEHISKSQNEETAKRLIGHLE